MTAYWLKKYFITITSIKEFAMLLPLFEKSTRYKDTIKKQSPGCVLASGLQLYLKRDSNTGASL